MVYLQNCSILQNQSDIVKRTESPQGRGPEQRQQRSVARQGAQVHRRQVTNCCIDLLASFLSTLHELGKEAWMDGSMDHGFLLAHRCQHFFLLTLHGHQSRGAHRVQKLLTQWHLKLSTLASIEWWCLQSEPFSGLVGQVSQVDDKISKLIFWENATLKLNTQSPIHYQPWSWCFLPMYYATIYIG